MAMLHVVYSTAETPEEERMVKSRRRSGIRQYIKDKPTKWESNSCCWQTALRATPLMPTLVEQQCRMSGQKGLPMFLL